jgi:hypothetical protein
MRGILLIFSTLLVFNATAGKITMNDPDEKELQGGKRLCTYENSFYLFTLVTGSQSCPFSKTFDTNEIKK